MPMFGWFDDANRNKLDELIKEFDIKSVVEIGSFLGLSAVWFSERVEKVTCIDKFEEVETQETSNNMVGTLKQLGLPTNFYDIFLENIKDHKNIDVIKSWSKEGAPLSPEVDLIYIDGDHTYEGCKSDIELYLPKAKKIICGDDYTDRFPGVIKAADEIGAEHSGPFWWKVL